MSNKVIKVIDLSANPNKIIDAQDVKQLFNIRELIENNTIQANRIIDEAEEQAILIREDAYNNSILAVNQEQQELLEQCDEKINSVYDGLESELHNIVARILIRAGFVNPTLSNLQEIIRNEISSLKRSDLIVSVSCNSNVVEYIKEILPNAGEHVMFNIEEIYSDEECVLESNWYIFRLNIQDAIKKIGSIITLSTD